MIHQVNVAFIVRCQMCQFLNLNPTISSEHFPYANESIFDVIMQQNMWDSMNIQFLVWLVHRISVCRLLKLHAIQWNLVMAVEELFPLLLVCFFLHHILLKNSKHLLSSACSIAIFVYSWQNKKNNPDRNAVRWILRVKCKNKMHSMCIRHISFSKFRVFLVCEFVFILSSLFCTIIYNWLHRLHLVLFTLYLGLPMPCSVSNANIYFAKRDFRSIWSVIWLMVFPFYDIWYVNIWVYFKAIILFLPPPVSPLAILMQLVRRENAVSRCFI